MLSWSDSLIVIEIPEAAETAQLEILYYGNSLIGPYIEILRIDSIQPYFGLPRDTIQIFGDGFHDVKASNFVTIDGLDAEIIDWMDGYIVAIVPEGIDSGYVVVHVDGYQSNGVHFYNLAGDDINQALHLCQYIKFTYSGYITLTGSYGSKYREYVIMNSGSIPLEWTFNDFIYGRIRQNEMYYSYNGAYGSLNVTSENLDSLYIEHQYALPMIAPGAPDWCDTWRYGFHLNNVPLTYIDTYPKIEIRFELSGPQLQSHISEITMFHHYYEEDYWSENHYFPGSDHDIWRYEDTDWDNEEYPPSLIITFSNVPFE